MDLPMRQARLRDACCAGDTREVGRLLSSRVEGWRGCLLRLVGLGRQRLQEPASLDFTYVDDYSRHLLHYVASGISGRHRSLAQLYNNEDVTCRSAHAAQRAALMRHLLTSGQLKGIDLNVTDAGGKSVVFWAVLSHSDELLQALCSLAQAHGAALNVAKADHIGTTPLDIAVASQQWAAVRTLMQHGALEGSVRLRNAVESLPELSRDAPHLRGAAPWTSLTGFVGGLLRLGWPAPASATISKSTSLASIGASEDEDCEPSAAAAQRAAPLVFSSMQEVETFWNQQALYVSSVCSVSVAAARHLLKDHHHDVDAAIQGFLMHKGKDGQLEADITRQQSMQTCCVCFQQYSTLDTNVVLPCGHTSTCVACWRLYIASQLDDGKGAALHCTEPGCGMPLPLEEAKKVLSPERYAQLQRQVLNSYVDSNPHMKWCPRPGCGCSISLRQQVRDSKVPAEALSSAGPLTVRCKCGYAFCWDCGEQAHEPASCEQVRSWKKMLTEEHKEQNLESEMWVSSHTQPCPNCAAKVERSGGCNHMICTVCGQHYCYVCGRDWSLHGPQSGGFYECRLGGAPPPPSMISALGRNVGSALRSTWKLICTRQATYIRRYFAQSDDARELRHLVTHLQRLLGDALPDRDARSALRRRSGSWSGAASLAGGGGSTHTRQASSGGGSATSAPGALSSPVAEHAAACGCSAAGSCGVGSGDAAARAELPSSERASAGCSHSRAASTSGGEGLHRRRTSTPLADVAEAACENVVAPAAEGSSVESEAAAHHAARVGLAVAAAAQQGRHRRQRLSSETPMDGVLSEWERAVSNGRAVLRNTCIATYYMERSAERQYLESLQGRLELQIEQLTEMLRAMPHRSSVLEAPRGENGRVLAAPDAISLILGHLTAVLRDMGQGLLALGMVLSSRGSALREISVHGQQLRDQFYYAVALNQRRSRIVQLLQRVNHTCHAIVKTGRVKRF